MQIKVKHPKPAVIFLYDYSPSILSEKIQEFLVDVNTKRRKNGEEDIVMSKYEEMEESAFAVLPADEQLVLQKLNRVRVLNMIEKIVVTNDTEEETLTEEGAFYGFLANISKEDFQILTEKSLIKVGKEDEEIQKKTSQKPTE